MSMVLLSTKLHIPRAHRALVQRPRLLAQLDACLEQDATPASPAFARKLTLICAPAGFGKTTLLSEWGRSLRASTPTMPVAWLSLDEHDDDPVPFWTYLIAALRSVDAGLGHDAGRLLQGAEPPAAQALLTPVLNRLAALDRGLVLVLDDYHLISSKAIHQGLAFFLDHQPQNVHLVISTRADPPLPLFRLRARGLLTELRSDDLRFATVEAAIFLNGTMGLSLAPEDVQALEARTEGWIVGLQLAALALQGTLSMQSRDGAREFISSFTGSHHYVLEYLTEEVVRRQPEGVRTFLIQTSILDRLCGSLCDAVCAAPEGEPANLPPGDPGPAEALAGEAMLAHLQERNLFIIPLDDERRWLRYHHLFADLLGNLLRKEFPPEQIRTLHRRASAWHEQNGSPEDAIKHALQAQDFKGAAALITRAAQGLLAHGRLSTLLRWTEALPEDTLHAQPHLRLYQGWALHLSGRSDAAERMLQDTKKTLQALPSTPETIALRGQIAALLTGIATVHHDPATIIQEGQEALACLPQDDLIPRARTYIALGTAHAYDDDLEKAIRMYRQGRDLALEAGNPFLATAAIELLAGIQIYHLGRLHDGARTLQQVLDLGTVQDGTQHPFSGTAHALLAELHLEWNDLDAAAGYLEKGIDLQARGGIGYGLIHTFCTKARLQSALGDADGTLEAIDKAEKALQAFPLWHLVIHHACCQVRLRLWLGDVGEASLWANGKAGAIQGALPESLPIYLGELQRISQARVHLAQGETESALATLEGLDAQAQAAGRTAQVIEICLVKALALQAQGNATAALESLERSLALAEPAGYVRLFLEGGPPLAALLSGVVRRGTSSRYALKLLQAFGGPASDPESVPGVGNLAAVLGQASLPEPLTSRELEVLDLIGQGYSNQQISDRLVVTLHTVKKHSSNIYGKLGVSGRTRPSCALETWGFSVSLFRFARKLGVRGRTQAIVRARDLGLLS